MSGEGSDFVQRRGSRRGRFPHNDATVDRGWPGRRGEEPQCVRAAHCLGAVPTVELPKQVPDVILDVLHTDVQQSRQLPVRATGTHELEDPCLSLGKDRTACRTRRRRLPHSYRCAPRARDSIRRPRLGGNIPSSEPSRAPALITADGLGRTRGRGGGRAFPPTRQSRTHRSSPDSIPVPPAPQAIPMIRSPFLRSRSGTRSLL